MALVLEPIAAGSRPAAGLELRSRAALQHAAVLAAICALAFVAALGSTPLWEPDEPRFAAASRSMVESGDYLNPTFNGRPRWEKPVLLYWLQALPMRLGLPPEWWARLPAALAGIAGVAGVYGLGALWWSSLAGLVAAAGLATSFRFASYSRQGLTDIPAVACIVLTFLAFESAVKRPAGARGQWAWWTGWMLVGVTALVKGPLAVIAPVIWLGVAGLARGDAVPWRRAIAGSALAACIGGSWYAYMALGHGLSFLNLSIGYEVVRRFADESFPGPARGAFFYWRILPGELAPWTLVVAVSAVLVAWRWRALDDRARNGLTMAAAWCLGVMLLCSLSQYKLPHYTLPAYPAAFLISGFAVATLVDRGERRALAGAVGATAWILVALGSVAGAAVGWLPAAFRVGGLGVAVCSLTGGVISLGALRRSLPVATLALAGGIAAAYAAIAALVLPALADQAYPYPALGRIVAEQIAPEAALGALGVHTSLVFYARREVTFLETPGAVARFLDFPEPRLAVLTGRELGAARPAVRTPLTVIASLRQRNPRLSHLLDGRFVRGTADVLLVANEAAARSRRATPTD